MARRQGGGRNGGPLAAGPASGWLGPIGPPRRFSCWSRRRAGYCLAGRTGDEPVAGLAVSGGWRFTNRSAIGPIRRAGPVARRRAALEGRSGRAVAAAHEQRVELFRSSSNCHVTNRHRLRTNLPVARPIPPCSGHQLRPPYSNVARVATNVPKSGPFRHRKPNVGCEKPPRWSGTTQRWRKRRRREEDARAREGFRIVQHDRSRQWRQPLAGPNATSAGPRPANT